MNAVVALNSNLPQPAQAALLGQVERLEGEVATFQKKNNPRGESLTLANLANVRLMLSDVRQALQEAEAALALSKKSRDTEAELSQILIVAHAHVALGEADKARGLLDDGKYACNRAREAKFASGARAALENLEAVISATEGRQATEDTASAGALCALSHVQLAQGNFQLALPAAKEALDHYESCGDKKGVVASALALAQAHMAAGLVEDAQRKKLFLPPATGHPAAAAYAAERAKSLAVAMGATAAEKQAQDILGMERVRSCYHLRMQPFSYDSWNTVNP